MLCPGCAAELQTVSVIGIDESFRCARCGGFWVPNWVVNALAEGKSLEVKEHAGESPAGGTNACPTDGWILNSPHRELVPEGFVAGVCDACRNWWFPHNSLFTFYEAMKAKREYTLQWNKDGLKKVALPALSLIFVIGAVATSIVLVQLPQRVGISASSEASGIAIVFIGQGDVDIVFASSMPVSNILYRPAGQLNYSTVPVQFDGRRYRASLRKLTPGNYIYKIFEREYPLVIEYTKQDEMP